ncbi:MAG TPA: gamma-glutamyltransferase, partial [Gemmatimonadaceae bacterium]|nr:gamma-glutamyltransferase [Gemmatimonadaceae bacterium]
ARIITGVAQIMINVIDYRLSLGDAMSAPRFHAQDYPQTLELEPDGYDSTVVRQLDALGQQPLSTKRGGFAWVQSILRVGNSWQGVSEPRGRGLAAGY